MQISSETDENCSGMLQEYWREMYVSYASECYHLQSFLRQRVPLHGVVDLLGAMYRRP